MEQLMLGLILGCRAVPSCNCIPTVLSLVLLAGNVVIFNRILSTVARGAEVPPMSVPGINVEVAPLTILPPP